jgi:hypothetical protein
MSKFSSFAFAIAALVFAYGATPNAQALNQASASQGEDEIVVTGLRLRELIGEFVGEVSAAAPAEDQMARWDRRICPGVAGLSARHGQFIVDRISQRAFGVGLEAGAPGCRPNVLVLVTPDSDRLARSIVDDYPDLVGFYAGQAAVTRGREQLEDFANTPRAVRWWHVSQTVTADGRVLGNANTQPTPGGLRNAQIVRHARAGRLSRNTRQDFNRALIVVDARRAEGKQFDALADYIAMAALAQLEPDADTSAMRTISNLFSDDGSGPTAMSNWDLAYLEGLYRAPRTARNAQQQTGAIARSMEREVATTPPTP